MNKLVRRCACWVVSTTMLPLIFAAALTASSHAIGASMDAASFPIKPVRLIIPYAPGGTNDVLGRIVAPHMSEGLRQSVIIDNRPGAEGNLAVELGARAAPDGYTIVLVNARLAGARIFNKDVKYDLVRDFTPVGEIGTGESVLVVRPTLPVENTVEFINYAKARPGQLTLAGTATTYPMELFKHLAQIEVTIVPYKGFASAAPDILSGRVDALVGSVNDVTPHVKANRLKALGIAGTRPVPELPNVPPVAATLPGFDIGMFYGLSAPARTPPEVVRRLTEELKRTVARADAKQQLEKAFIQPSTASTEVYAQKIRDEIAKWERFARASGLTAR
jgi:tripartite-type tricarboxylate transporter receptor subunit TctC